MALFEIVVLGSGGSIPTQNRNHPSIAITCQGWNLLFDAGEDVQRQYERAGLGNNKHMAVFISHMHADHLLGLPGLLLRFSLLGRLRPLQVFGPKGLIEYIKLSQETIHLGTTFETTIYQVSPGPLIKFNDVQVSAFEVDHRCPAFGYEILHQRSTGSFLPDLAERLGVPRGPLWHELASGKTIHLDDGRVVTPQEVTTAPPPPVKIVYSGDTRPCKTLRHAAQNASVLISESMYTSRHADLAADRGHMTAAQAATLARDTGVGWLILMHYSPRYGDGTEILNEAKSIFENTILAKDLMRLSVLSDGSIQPSTSSFSSTS